MTAYFQSLLDFVGLHPGLAIFTAFMVSAGEALLVIGLFVPSTVVLVGIGGLIGLGKIAFWPIFIATTLGAVAGDAVSYWIGHIYKERLAEIWPFCRYRGMLATGQRYFALHGGKSIVVGRFIPGVKAVVPGVAGMMGMSITRFTVLNIVSAIAWAGAHLLPGLSAGIVLVSLGMISKRLAILGFILIVGVALALWLTRLTTRLGIALMPQIKTAALDWASKHNNQWGLLVERAIAPQHMDFRLYIFLIAILIAAFISFFALLGGVATQGEIVLFDSSLSQFLQSLRTSVTDRTMVVITMLGDWVVNVPVVIAALVVLVAFQRHRLAIGLISALIGTAVFVKAMKLIVHASRPIILYSGAESFSFPSGHSTMTATIYGIIGLIIFKSARPVLGRISVVLCATIICLVAFSRVYLGAHWPSDVIAGLLFGAGATAAFALVIRKEHLPGRLASRLAGAGLAALLIVGTAHVYLNYAGSETLYARQPEAGILLSTRWREGGWRQLPANRIDLVGEQEEPFLVQWNGSVVSLQRSLETQGWRVPPTWSLTTLNTFALAGAAPADLPAIAKQHHGHFQSITMVKPGITGGAPMRYVFRAWPQMVRLNEGIPQTILQGSVLAETIEHPLNQLSLPFRDDEIVCSGHEILTFPNTLHTGKKLAAPDGACGGELVLATPTVFQ